MRVSRKRLAAGSCEVRRESQVEFGKRFHGVHRNLSSNLSKGFFAHAGNKRSRRDYLRLPRCLRSLAVCLSLELSLWCVLHAGLG